MKMTIIKFCISLSLIALAFGYLFAEVSVEVDGQGKYLRTIYIEKATGKTLKIWTAFGNKPTIYPLNPFGDLSNDLRPAIRENPSSGNAPYVVWPHYDGYDYDIVFAKWSNGAWSAIQYIEDDENIYDDLDPSIDFDRKGRPYSVWWRNEGGIGTVYISCFLKTRWMLAYPISEESIDSWDPEIKFNINGQIEVTYSTNLGLDKKIVTINLPDTITDDIDPFGTGVVDVSDGSVDESDVYGQ